MDLTRLWRNAQALEKIRDLTLNEWHPKEERNDCTFIISPDEEFFCPMSNNAMQLYFWNYIEHRTEDPIRYRQNQLGYIWFTKGEGKKSVFSIPSYTIGTDPDYEAIILKRTEEITGFLRTRFHKVYAGILHGEKIKEITFEESLRTLFAPEEIIRPNYDPDVIGKIERFTP